MKLKLTVMEAQVWICHIDNISTVIIELPDHQLIKDIEEDKSFNVIVGGIVELLERELKEDVILSFVKHYIKSTFNVVLSDNKKFLANHVNKDYTNNIVKVTLLHQNFKGYKICITASDTELLFEIKDYISESPAHLIICYNKSSESGSVS